MLILNINNKDDFYNWLKENHNIYNECYINCNRSKKDNNTLKYIDAIYVALCFGWIDSTLKPIDNIKYQRFSPRRKNSNWSELNKARCKWLIKNNLMAESGLKILPKDFNDKLKVNDDILTKIKENKVIYDNFNNFPELYKRVRIGNIQQHKINSKNYIKSLNHFLKKTAKNEYYGDWNDNNKLIDIY